MKSIMKIMMGVLDIVDILDIMNIIEIVDIMDIIDIIDIMDIKDIVDIIDIMDIMKIMDIKEIMDIMNITAWMAMAGGVSPLFLVYCFKAHVTSLYINWLAGGFNLLWLFNLLVQSDNQIVFQKLNCPHRHLHRPLCNPKTDLIHAFKYKKNKNQGVQAMAWKQTF